MSHAPAATLDLSVVLPVHNERDNLAPLLEEIESVLAPTRRPFEVIAVDDGSTDGSAAALERLAASRPWLKVIEFRRNWGQSAALDAGFRAASGALVATLDADRQNDPADIPRMLEVMEREGCDFVAGRRAHRRDGWMLRRLPSGIANWIIRLVTRTRLHDLGCSTKLVRREVIENLAVYGEIAPTDEAASSS